MKYIRKAIALIIAVFFIAAVAIGFSLIFATRNVNLFGTAYVTENNPEGSDEYLQALSSVKSTLSEYKGKLIFGVSQSDVKEIVSKSGYCELQSFEKKYPCTLNITVKERLETFAVLNGNGTYSVYDAQMSYMTEKSQNVNNTDGLPNVLVNGAESSDYVYLASAAEVFKNSFGSLRVYAEEVTITRTTVENRDTLSVKLRCGLTMEMVDYSELTEQKAQALITAFQSLDDLQKLGGKITCQATSSGAIKVILPDGTIV